MTISAAEKPFYLDEYIDQLQLKQNKKRKVVKIAITNTERFKNICADIRNFFDSEWDKEQGNNAEKAESLLETQKKAIIGHITEVNYFKTKIDEYLRSNNLIDVWYPEWYENLVDAIFHENWGLAGLASWMRLKDSSSAKIIGDRIYFLINGRQVLQEQRISLERFEQLRQALLLRTPEKRANAPYCEVYMLSGERISIYNGSLTKEGQPIIVFRKYIVDQYTFEEQARKNTIPSEAVPFFNAFARVGFNVAFTGAVRTGKTTFLCTWQSCEDPKLEGVMVETDPEIPLHKIMPKAPIMQLIADGEDLLNISKSLMRSDADYLIMAEARDGYALNLAVEMANKGTRHSKVTIHLTNPEDFCFDVANKIMASVGGNLNYTMFKVAKSFNYILHFVQLGDRSKKKLKGIYEIRHDPVNFRISVHQICKYDFVNDKWTFKYDIGSDKRELALEENHDAFRVFDDELRKLSSLFPMEEDNVIIPFFNNTFGR